MDFDPGFFSEDEQPDFESEAYEDLDEFAEDNYEDGYKEGHDSETEDDDLVETDELGNPILLVAAAGFGYHMAKDELEERQIAEELLKKREKEKVEPVKVPLATRHASAAGSPFRRWAAKVNQDPKKTKEPLDYTEEEQELILKHEAEGW